jgi:hypothetical protein
MDEYYCLSLNPEFAQVLQFILACNLKHSVHLNRTRFWVPHGHINTQFQLRFADTCPRCTPEDNTFQ